ncbi:MAG: hypothetical protein MUF04_02975 [Akkermansiaceae bacterium]|jgi:tetratricopeptide (TPR) repeat protein|nr:hypothetical protein [Akkermansiaceae bacterium]
MKQPAAILIGLVLLLPCPPARAAGPRITAAGSAEAFPLTSVQVTVRLLAEVAETELEIAFSNPQDRQREAEFILPLPAGAVVNGYALDIDGKLRPAVAVEKARALNAYESIKRQLIDPGIVEKQPDGSYRMRIFPVPPNGGRRFMVRFLQALPVAQEGYRYELPLDFGVAPDSFTCSITFPEGQRPDLAAHSGLSFGPHGSSGLTAALEKQAPPAKLAFTVPALREPALFVSRDSTAFFLSVPPPAQKPAPRSAPASLTLVWDASLNGLERNPAPTLDLLGEWFVACRQTEVRLVLLRDRATVAGRFTIRDGRWDDLKKALLAVSYDGMADLSAMPREPAGNGPVVWVSHGPFLTDGIPPGNRPDIVIRTAADAWPGHTATTVVDLTTATPAAALARLTTRLPALRLISEHHSSTVSSGHGGSGAAGAGPPAMALPWGGQQPDRPTRVFGRFRQPMPEFLQAVIGHDGNSATIRVKPALPEDGALVERLVAGEELAQMEAAVPVSPARVIAHGRQHGLASEFTSLLVLERMEDYLRYRIPPPEGPLREEYRQRLSNEEPPLKNLIWQWKPKVAKFLRDAPGVEPLLLKRVRQAAIWQQAVASQFPREQRDARAFATISGWLERTRAAIARKPTILTKDDLATWREEVVELARQGARLAETPLKAPPQGEPLAVSVRGLVNQGGVITNQSGLTLRKAIDLAGGPTPLGCLGAVALYRNAGMTIYNTLSKNYQDVPLYPGDMIVVLPPAYAEPWRDSVNSDPFGFAAAPPTRAADLPAVVANKDLWITDDPAADQGGGDPFGGEAPSQPAIQPPPGPARPSSGPPGDLAAFERALTDGIPPAEAYSALTAGRRQPPAVYVGAARLLAAAGQPDFASRVLSNLVALRPRDAESLFAFALWLAEFGQTDAAIATLIRVLDLTPEALPPRLALASIQTTARQPAAAAATLGGLQTPLAAEPPPAGAAIALTDFNARVLLDEKAPAAGATWVYAGLTRHLPADLRITLTSAEGAAPRCQVTEPLGAMREEYAWPSVCGGMLTAGGGMVEYLNRQALPGSYVIKCQVDRPTTVRVAVHTHWGKPQQQTTVTTHWLEPGESHTIAETDFVPQG